VYTSLLLICCCNVNSFCYSTGKSLNSQQSRILTGNNLVGFVLQLFLLLLLAFLKKWQPVSRYAMFGWLTDKVPVIQAPENNLKRLNGCPR
jgi:hypothetical protein